MSDSDSDSSTDYSSSGLDMQNLDTAISGNWTSPSVKPLSGGAPLAIPLVEDIDPNALFTQNKQIWQVGISVPLGTGSLDHPNLNGRKLRDQEGLYFKPMNGPTDLLDQVSSDDHTWIVLQSKPLLELLRSEEIMKGLDGLDRDPPGLDARHIFLRLAKLRERVVELETEAPRGESDTPAAPTEPVEPSIPQPQASSVPQHPPASQRSWFSSLTSLIPYFNSTPDLPPKDVVENSIPPKELTLSPLTVPQQLSELLNFVDDHYANMREQLKRLEADEHMPYHLLWTMCTPDSIIEGRDDATEKPTGVRVESWDYGAKGEVFTLHGTAYCWDGKMFKSSTGTVEIARYKGVVKIRQLPIQPLSNELRTRLIGGLCLVWSYDPMLTLNPQSGAGSTSRMDDYTYPSLHPAAKKPTGFPEQFDINFDFPDDVLCLMPPAHLGYSFSAKLWGRISVDALSEIVFNEYAFDRLVLSDEYKDIIKAQVETFSKKSDELVSDLVENKGGGMVMVLHGKPGTGKTLTAEAISEHLKCPLYMVSSGELGQYADSLEHQLRDIMTMSASWNAIVLIDEADVFLEARDNFDSSRNSK
ncbi:hypothetical protein FRC06_007634, partial [Ceratobasidium sp. 370]